MSVSAGIPALFSSSSLSRNERDFALLDDESAAVFVSPGLFSGSSSIQNIAAGNALTWSSFVPAGVFSSIRNWLSSWTHFEEGFTEMISPTTDNSPDTSIVLNSIIDEDDTDLLQCSDAEAVSTDAGVNNLAAGVCVSSTRLQRQSDDDVRLILLDHS